ncbi:hypothetical protein Zmor_023618 [Zophobas morio]|uniref:Uncharacterized protein n=1 Tax=Zophobas morio TaxID=2755281 RepID=A0AA38HYE0_9CUCU|nr:hypothetical protein Zmor_023618 [Zophobas morio]
MVYSVEQDTFIVMPYSRKRRVGVTACKQGYLAKYLDLHIQETSLEVHIKDAINGFVRSGSVNKGKSPGRPSVSEEVVDYLRRIERNSQTSLTRFPQQSRVPVAT